MFFKISFISFILVMIFVLLTSIVNGKVKTENNILVVQSNNIKFRCIGPYENIYNVKTKEYTLIIDGKCDVIKNI